MTHYAYVHARPNTGNAKGIFYVGKGTKQRHVDFYHRNKHHMRITAKYGQENILVGKIECSTADTAFLLEVGLIKCLRRMGVKLANKSDGGEGASGMKHTQETKDLLSKQRKGKSMSEEAKRKLSATNTGKKRGPTGKKMSDETKKKISDAKTGKRHTLEARQKISEAGKGRIFTEEARRKISEKLKGNKNGSRVHHTRKS